MSSNNAVFDSLTDLGSFIELSSLAPGINSGKFNHHAGQFRLIGQTNKSVDSLRGGTNRENQRQVGYRVRKLKS